MELVFTLQSLEASNTTTTSNTTILTPYGKNGTNGESISFTAIVVVSASANRIEIDKGNLLLQIGPMQLVKML